ncbi:MAG: undecaprenyl/decaprenyl-phosphate alpha-N-acetylglucosaminyl 1-phosphate transferase [Bacteroidetes bacterium]|nr:undecaprenyl/decaprenyl-phosphate alpha-N-acetylglucosaminyl 1-phosphate transferase [Bacteroidota bacterium]
MTFELLNSDLLLVLFAALLGGFIVMFSIPPIVSVAKAKNLIEKFGIRKIHKKEVPSLGGIAIFMGVILSTILSTNGYSFDVLKYIIASIMIMFFIGLKDDIMIISARKKFVLQIIAALILIFLGDIRITNFQGLFYITEINYALSVITTIFLIAIIINSFNFIDGIDGLASGIAFISSVFFGIWFYLSGHIQYAVLCFALAGSLVSFFYYNVFGKKNKLFMGDSGSLIIGTILSVATIQFIEFNNFRGTFYIYGAPAVAFGVLSVPMIDLLRVFFIRIMNGRSPFKPDNSHLHHCLLRINKVHLTVTLITIFINIIFIGAAVGLSMAEINVNISFGLLLLGGLLGSSIPYFMLPRQKKIIFKYLYSRLKDVASLFY